MGRLWTSCRKILSALFLTLHSKGRVHGLQKTWVDRWHLVSNGRSGYCRLTDYRWTVNPKFSDILYHKVTNENEKLSRQNVSTGCPQPMDYLVLIYFGDFLRHTPQSQPRWHSTVNLICNKVTIMLDKINEILKNEYFNSTTTLFLQVEAV